MYTSYTISQNKMSMNAIFRDPLTSETTEQPNISLDETSLVVAREDMENEQEGTEEIQEM